MLLRIIAAVSIISALISGGFVIIADKFVGIRAGFVLYLPLFLISEAVLLNGIFNHNTLLFGRILYRGARNRKIVSITFDDGPNDPYTSQILDILNAYDIKATFFVIGRNALKYPQSLKRMIAEGHDVGNHTFSHKVLPLSLPSQIRSEIKKTSDIIQAITSRRPVFFRAPHGWRNPWLNCTVRKQGCLPVAWTFGVWDTDRPGVDTIVKRTLKKMRNGAVLLFHDGRGLEDRPDSSQLVQALPLIIEKLKADGFRFVKLPQLMADKDDHL